VATVLATEGDVSDEDILLAAILHDTVEETTFSEIEERFGAAVAGLVREVTDDKSLQKAERKRLQIEHARASSARTKQLKVADKIWKRSRRHELRLQTGPYNVVATICSGANRS